MKFRLLFILLFINYQVYCQNKINPDGFNKFYYGNGKVSSEGYMKNGNPDGFWKTYYINGNLKSAGIRKNFLLDSVWMFYYENGNLKESISYLNGKKNGYWYKYLPKINEISKQDLILISMELYLNDIKSGKSTYYYPDGKLMIAINYREGKKHGSSMEYTKDSIVNILSLYHNDFLIDREIINQVDYNSLRQGIWKEFYSNDNTKIEANYIDDKLHGLYKEFSSTGRILKSLRYENGIIAENNVEDDIEIEIKNQYDNTGKMISSGGYKNDTPIGMHREYTDNEDIIKTKVYNDYGKVIASGNVNSRGYKQDEWINYYNTGAIKSVGSYIDNKKDGKWIFYYTEGQIEQTGNYKSGKEDGYWEWLYKNGNKKREEHFYNGQEDGEMVEYSESGAIICKGDFIEGLKEGQWMYKVGDHTEKGSYKYGLKDGFWKHYYNDLVLEFEGNYIQGNPDGKHKYYFDNGKLREERIYVMGKKEKTWRKFDAGGNLIMILNYKNDKEIKIDGVRIEE